MKSEKAWPDCLLSMEVELGSQVRVLYLALVHRSQVRVLYSTSSDVESSEIV